jgi:hypothetical protein
VCLIITEANRIITVIRRSESVVMSTVATVYKNQTCLSLYQPMKEVQHDSVIISTVNKPSEVINYDSAGEFSGSLSSAL